MLTIVSDEPYVLASTLHDVDARRLTSRAKCDAFAIRRICRLSLAGSCVGSERMCILAANSLHKQIKVAVLIASINKVLTVGSKHRIDFGPGLHRELQRRRAGPIACVGTRPREVPHEQRRHRDQKNSSDGP